MVRGLSRLPDPAPADYGQRMGVSLLILVYVVVPLLLAYLLYFVLRKAIAHGIRDAQRAAAKEGLAPLRIDRT
jgi:hypothetical protein